MQVVWSNELSACSPSTGSERRLRSLRTRWTWRADSASAVTKPGGSIDGIGAETAARLVAEPGDPAQFHSAGALAAYVGVVPALRQSGKRQPRRASLTALGHARLRAMLWMPVLTAVRSGIVFPVSSVMLDRIDDYRSTLQAHSGPLMPFIEWRPTPERDIEVLNATGDLYRYFDGTDAAEFLYACVRRTVEQDLPREIDYLRRHDDTIRRIMDAVEMPDRVAGNLMMFIRQNRGTLSKRRREDEFRQLRDDEVSLLEGIVRDAFEGFDDGAGEPRDGVADDAWSCLIDKHWRGDANESLREGVSDLQEAGARECPR